MQGERQKRQRVKRKRSNGEIEREKARFSCLHEVKKRDLINEATESYVKPKREIRMNVCTC